MTLLTIVLVITFLVVLGHKKSWGKTASDVFSKEWSFTLKGIMAILIVLHHISTHLDKWYCTNDTFQFVVFKELICLSPTIVGIFIFISGYGLTSSYIRTEGQYLDNFFSKRFPKVLNPFILACVITLITFYAIVPEYNFEFTFGSIHRITGWFVPVFLLFYLVFYVTFRVNTEHLKYAAGGVTLFVVCLNLFLIMMNFGNYWWQSNICFPAGIWYRIYEHNITDYINQHLKRSFISFNLLIIAVTFISIWYGRYPGITLPVIISALVVLYTYLRKIELTKVTRFLNNISYEIFLIHSLLLEICNIYFVQDCSIPLPLLTLLFLAVTVITAMIFKLFFSRLLKLY